MVQLMPYLEEIMKKIFLSIFLIEIVFSIMTSCASASSNNHGSSKPFFTGSGGAGMRLGIVVPQSQGLSENQTYLPSMVQGVLVSNMSKFSAISVLDRVSLDRVLAKTLDPTYEDNFDIVRLGHVAQVGYLMTGSIIKTSSGFSLQINVTDTTPNARTIASYSGNYTTAQLDNHTAIHQVSFELLSQIGVQLTSSARKELLSASPRQEINAQTALAQGIIAQRKGLAVEAILHYFDASVLEATASEALKRMSVATEVIAIGSLGTQIRNDIQQRNEWIKLIEETEKFYFDNPQFNIIELYFNSNLDLGSIDYKNKRAFLKFPVKIMLNNEKANSIIKVLTNIQNGLKATGRQDQWGISLKDRKTYGRGAFGGSYYYFAFAYIFDFELINDKGKVIASTTTDSVGVYYDFSPYHNEKFTLVKPLTLGGFGKYESVYFDEFGSGVSYSWAHEPGFTAKVSDITDRLSIRLKNISVHRVDISFYRGQYVFMRYSKPIAKGNNIIPVNTFNF